MEEPKEVREVLLLKSSPHNYNDVKNMAIVLDNHPLVISWNIDFDDCDKILRIESNRLKVDEIINALHQINIWSEDL
jgi:hypothetical protein